MEGKLPALTIEDAYRKWAADLVAYATALVGPSEATDVVADTFATLLARGDDAWSEVRDPRGYVFRCVLNTARQRSRSSSRRSAREQMWAPTADAAELLPEPGVDAALASLSLRQRAVVYLTYWHDLDPASVAIALGVTPGAVKRHLARARRALRAVLLEPLDV